MSNLLLSTAYFPPISYFSKIANYNNVLIETQDNYIKQTYRNRCNIMSANGKLTLSIPVIKSGNLKTPTKDIIIDYDTNWQKNHFRSIMSAYKSSPFYEFYIDDFLHIFENKTKYLLDLNNNILSILVDNLEIESNISFTKEYLKDIPLSSDYRNNIIPKKETPEFKQKEYWQVFIDKFPFEKDLSIIDLLFNKGPEASLFL